MTKLKFKLADIKQRHLEEWAEAWNQFDRHSRPALEGWCVRAAIQAGWFEQPQTEYIAGDGNGTEPKFMFGDLDVGDLEGWQVRQLADAINERYNEAVTIPKN